MPLSVDKPGMPLHRYSGFTTAVWQCIPESRGRVSLVSTNPLAAPRIETNYLAKDVDRKTLVAGLRMAREVYREKPFRDLWESEAVPGAECASDQELLDYARRTGGTVFHASGTCRMGTDELAVVDPELCVRGIERLRVIDASVMPTVTSANTNAAALMIGEKGAALVLG
jgi:choline dehydrogenase